MWRARVRTLKKRIGRLVLRVRPRENTPAVAIAWQNLRRNMGSIIWDPNALIDCSAALRQVGQFGSGSSANWKLSRRTAVTDYPVGSSIDVRMGRLSGD